MGRQAFTVALGLVVGIVWWLLTGQHDLPIKLIVSIVVVYLFLSVAVTVMTAVDRRYR